MEKQPVDAAMLLEDIHKNAEPYSLARKFFESALGNKDTGFPKNAIQFLADPETNTLTVTHLIPVDVVMKGISGSLEDVIAYARTGLKKGEEISVTTAFNNLPCVSICQTFTDEHTCNDYIELINKFYARLAKHGTSGKTG